MTIPEAPKAEGEEAREVSPVMPDEDELEQLPETAVRPLHPTLAAPGTGRIYGHGTFARDEIEVFLTTDGSRAPETYVLGPGDRIRVTIFGASQVDLMLEVNSQGYVRTEETPQIYLKGLNLAQARSLMARRMAQFFSFRPEQFVLTLQTARNITVNIFGETQSQGSFDLSALNTAFNALAAAGGPTEKGSVRNIQHIRGNTRRTMDVYQFMHDPAVQFDFDLQHNDIIHVPVARKVVDLRGSVVRPMRYELLDGETLNELIAFAGGIRYDTYPDFVQIERIEEGEMTLREWSLADALSGRVSIELRDGDIVRLRPVQRPLEQFAEINGAVYYPGRYDLRQQNTLGKLMNSAQLVSTAVLDRIFIERTQPDETIRIIPVNWQEMLERGEDMELQRRDRVVVFDEERYANMEYIEVRGNVRSPVRRQIGFDVQIRLDDVLAFAGGARSTAADTAYVVRRDLFNPDIIEHIRLSLSEQGDFLLGPGDQLNVYSRDTYTNIPQVSVQGAVQSAFSTSWEPGLTLSDLFLMAGGLREKAQRNRIDVYRLQLSPVDGTQFDRIVLAVDEHLRLLPEYEGFQLMPYDQVVVREHPMFDVDRSVQISGQVYYPGNYLLESQNVRLSDILREAGGLTDRADRRNATLYRSRNNIGPVGIDLDRALSRRPGERHDPIVQAGDIITIPEYSNTIRIHVRATRLGEQSRRDIIPGRAFAPGSRDVVVTFVYQGPRSAKWYVENFAGGFAPNADKNSLTVTFPNGRVQGTSRRLLFFRSFPSVEPGSIISLEYEVEKEPRGRRLFGGGR